MKKLFTFATAVLLMSGAAFAHEGKNCGKEKSCCKKGSKTSCTKDSKTIAKATVKKA